MITKTVLRTLFYQFFLIFIGLSIGFIMNAEYVGMKSLLVQKSVKNIFDPIEYDQQMERWVKGWGAFKVYSQKDKPEDFEIIDENVYYNDEWYWCRFKYKDKNGNIKIEEATARVKWKTWEYYYDYQVLDTPEKIRKKIQEDKEQIEKRKKEIEKAMEKEKEIKSNSLEKNIT